jgi:hypothetical protein
MHYMTNQQMYGLWVLLSIIYYLILTHYLLIYKIGVIIYECLSGVFPFDDKTSIEEQIKDIGNLFPHDPWSHVSKEGKKDFA